MTQDEEHLRLLAIFHYVLAGLTACASLFFGLYVVLGVLMGTGVLGSDDPQSQRIGPLLALFGLGGTGLVLAFAAAVAYAGRCIATRRRRTYCIVIAALLCTNAPLGTVLGVFTILVLARDSVRELFGESG